MTTESRTVPEIYLDHNAGSPVRRRAREAMLPWLGERFGNPSSVHRRGQEARAAVERARGEVARLVGASSPDGVVFTSGGTEAVQLALLGMARACPDLPLLVSAIEHPSVLDAAMTLAEGGREVRQVPVTSQGMVELTALEGLLSGPALVAVMWANNEVGTLQPIAEVARIVAAQGGYLLVDAVQAASRVPVDQGALAVRSAVALSSHKLGGPAGVGALVLDPKLPFRAPIPGAPQERGRRPGTENLPGVVGFGAVASEADFGDGPEEAEAAKVRDRLEEELLERVPGCRVLGGGAPRLPNTSCLLFPGADGESIVFGLDLQGIRASTGAACASGSTDPSHVVAALGVPKDEQRCCVRFSTGPANTLEEVERVVEILVPLVERLREAR